MHNLQFHPLNNTLDCFMTSSRSAQIVIEQGGHMTMIISLNNQDSHLNCDSTINHVAFLVFFPYMHGCIDVGEEQTELGSGIKWVISLASLHSHKWSKSNPSWILLIFIWCQFSILCYLTRFLCILSSNEPSELELMCNPNPLCLTIEVLSPENSWYLFANNFVGVCL